MKYTSGQAFLADPHKCIAILGLSGVGKTTCSRSLPADEWFHFSVDYRIWTHHLSDQLNDYLKSLALQQPVLRDLLLKDAISVEHRVQFDNLYATSNYMGMLGNPKQQGSNERDFGKRMKEYAAAEIAAMLDIPHFQKRAQKLYGYPHFLVDGSGSLCEIIELDDPHDRVAELLEKNCVVVYIEASEEHKQELLRRQAADPKPIYYRPDFIAKHLSGLLKAHHAKRVTDIDPNDVGRYLYPRLLEHRAPRYRQLADRLGYSVSMSGVNNGLKSGSLLDIVAAAMDSRSRKPQ